MAKQNINANSTTTLKSTPGRLHRVIIGKKGAAANVLDIYDNTAGSGTKIASIDTVNAAIGAIEVGADFGTGLTAVLGTGTAADVTLVWD